MARYKAQVAARGGQHEVFEYLADFSNAKEWDPSVRSAERLDAGEIKVGSTFRLVVDFMGRSSALVYAITELEPSRLVTFSGESSTVTSLDTITFEPAGAGHDGHLRRRPAAQGVARSSPTRCSPSPSSGSRTTR